MKSKSAWYPIWNRQQLGSEQRRIQHHKGWKGKLVNAEHSEPWQETLLHERFSTSEEGDSSVTVAKARQQEDASEMLEEYDDGQAMEWRCVYGSRTS